MNKLTLRTYSRASVSLGSFMIIAGGVMMYFGVVDLGDYVMVAGGVLLIGGALALATTPTGDKDAG